MKVVFDRDKLLTALGPAAAIAPGKKTIASVEGILFECPGDEPGTCRLTAYDMEKGLRTFVEAKSMTEGTFIINSQNILQIVRSMPSGDITIDIDDKNRAKITGGASFFEIGSIPGENYPSLPLLSGDRNYTIPQYIFRSLISKTAFAIDQNAQKPIFNGVYFCVEAGMLKCVGCDGNRLGFAEYEIGEDSAETSFIVPGKILFELMKMIHDTEDDITISVARKHCIFKIGDYTYFSRLIDGEYLNYKRIIPEAFEKTAYINTDMMMGAVERASLVTEDKLGGSSSKTYIKLDFEDNVLKISSASTGGSVYEELPIAMTGEALVIGFKCKYLLDALKASDECETVKFNMNGSLMGICIESGDSEETEEKKPVKYKLFVMPIRMNGR
ncbi:MAG: DNA polymerase III subunit beta [Clostridia bacterium]|nr:DNA polymerase III subunit beta [Clostridia bacterium]